jgi:hypothetical protein
MTQTLYPQNPENQAKHPRNTSAIPPKFGYAIRAINFPKRFENFKLQRLFSHRNAKHFSNIWGCPHAKRWRSGTSLLDHSHSASNSGWSEWICECCWPTRVSPGPTADTNTLPGFADANVATGVCKIHLIDLFNVEFRAERSKRE